MADASAWMPFYIGDYLADTMHLTTEQHGAYVLLIIAYWRNRGPLPAADTKLRSIARLDAKAWQQSRDTLAEFFLVEGDAWRHTRIDKELARADEITNKRSAAGRASAQQRANTRSTRVEHTDEQTPQQTGRPLPSPSPESPPSPPQAGGPDAPQGEGKSEAPSRASGTNPRSIAKAKREAEEAAALAEARRKRDAEDDAKWLPRLTEFQQTGNWPSAWGTPPNPNPAISETGVFLPKRLWPAMAEARALRSLVTDLPDNLRRVPVDTEAAELAARYEELTRRTA